MALRPHHIREVLFTEAQIQRRLGELALEMADSCRDERFVIVGVLRGSFMFLADLVRKLNAQNVHPRIDFMTLQSWGAGTESSGSVQIRKDIIVDVAGADVLIVDDILDTGRTLSFAREHLAKKGARSVRICALLDKHSQRIVPVAAEHIGFRIEDVFVVGYGLDYDSHYRELPYIAKVTFEDGQ